MSTFISVDSYFRDVTLYPNPASFKIPTSLTNGWATENRTVKAVLSHQKTDKCPPLMYEVCLSKVVIPYVASLLNEPYLYIQFTSDQEKNFGLINTLADNVSGANLKTATFEIFFDKIQGNNVYILYCSNMSQVMRLDPKGSYTIRIFNRLGQTILSDTFDTPNPPNPTLQIAFLLELRPYKP